MFLPHDSDDNLTDEQLTDDPTADGTRLDDVPRYGSLVIGDGTSVVYDRDQYEAWIRSDNAVDLDSMA